MVQNNSTFFVDHTVKNGSLKLEGILQSSVQPGQKGFKVDSTYQKENSSPAIQEIQTITPEGNYMKKFMGLPLLKTDDNNKITGVELSDPSTFEGSNEYKHELQDRFYNVSNIIGDLNIKSINSGLPDVKVAKLLEQDTAPNETVGELLVNKIGDQVVEPVLTALFKETDFEKKYDFIDGSAGVETLHQGYDVWNNNKYFMVESKTPIQYSQAELDKDLADDSEIELTKDFKELDGHTYYEMVNIDDRGKATYFSGFKNEDGIITHQTPISQENLTLLDEHVNYIMAELDNNTRGADNYNDKQERSLSPNMKPNSINLQTSSAFIDKYLQLEKSAQQEGMFLKDFLKENNLEPALQQSLENSYEARIRGQSVDSYEENHPEKKIEKKPIDWKIPTTDGQQKVHLYNGAIAKEIDTKQGKVNAFVNDYDTYKKLAVQNGEKPLDKNTYNQRIENNVRHDVERVPGHFNYSGLEKR
ncbi:MAG: hypothetical protein ACQESC_02690 [Nanobdellota archaeon]